MDHGKFTGSQRCRAEPNPIDPGNDPPLTVDGGARELIDRRRISVRWYSGTILNGLCGAALMGGAVYVALDGQAVFAALPERVETLRGALGRDKPQAAIRKSDRLQSATELHSAARQIIRVPTTARGGDREGTRMRPFVRVASNLSLSTSELSANIPPFNAARVQSTSLASSGATPEIALPQETAPADDADVSFVTRDLAPLLGRAKISAVVPMDEVLTRVREAANWMTTASLGGGVAGERMSYAPESGGVDPYAGFETRIVPENVTLLPKTAGQATGGNSWDERSVLVKRGENAIGILRDAGATTQDAQAIAASLGSRGSDGGLKEGQKLRILMSPATAGQRQRPVRIIVVGESGSEAMVALSDTGKYVAVDVQNDDAQIAEAEEDDTDDQPGTVRLYQSIYETALRQQVPRPVVDELIRIYSYDVDFQRRVQAGDSFEILYPGDEEGSPEKVDVLYASLTIGGETKRYYRFTTPDDGQVDFYDETGKSAKKFLVRKPVDVAIMRSGYGWRRHPIMGYSKMHTGVDWAAPRGTPIYASGNGVIEKAGWDGGYGKYVKIRHNNGYETAYGHMSGFARGIQPGTRVQQGQVIGFVGSTGLSTGAHVHYEILVNGRFVDPMRIKLPRGRSLEGPVLANFEQERDKFDSIMSRKTNVPMARAPSARREAARR